ncbi:hypothetical protein KM043_009005 [Ampulex compressa]|nr:hypothetical protein KM043_009005 [Ampulex compressa]
MNQILECLGPIAVDVGSGLKLIFAISKANQMKRLIKRIENDWRSIETAAEYSILSKYHLENLTQGEELRIELHPSLEDDEAFRNIVKCIRMHNEAIEFANILESLYSTAFLLQAGFNMAIISTTCFQAGNNLEDLHELVRHLALQVATLFHLYFESSQSQQLMDHSARVQEHLMSTKWYRTSMRTRRVINFMIMRTRHPFTLTAGKVFDVSMETFSVVRILERPNYIVRM